MNSTYNEKSSLNFALTSRGMFRVLLILLWTQNTILNYVTVVFRRLPIVSIFADYIIPAVIFIAVIFALPWLIKQVHATDFLFYILCLGVVIITMMLPIENSEFIKDDCFRILASAIPLFFVGLAYCHEACKKDLFWCSLLSVIVVVVYQFYGLGVGHDMTSDNMDKAYNVLPSVMYLIYWAKEQGKFRYWLPVIVGVLLLLSLGTRGPILALLIFVMVMLFIAGKKNFYARLFSIVLMIAILLVVFFSGFLTDFSRFMQGVFEDIGTSTRIFDYYLDGDIAESSGRDNIARTTLDAIKESPLLGYGLMGDRVVNDGSYAHNLFLELWCQFGVLIGSAIIIALLYITVKALWFGRKSNEFYFLLMLVCMVYTKLMFSNSYIVEPYFFLMIGVAIGVIRRNKDQQAVCYEKTN